MRRVDRYVHLLKNNDKLNDLELKELKHLEARSEFDEQGVKICEIHPAGELWFSPNGVVIAFDEEITQKFRDWLDWWYRAEHTLEEARHKVEEAIDSLKAMMNKLEGGNSCP